MRPALGRNVQHERGARVRCRECEISASVSEAVEPPASAADCCDVCGRTLGPSRLEACQAGSSAVQISDTTPTHRAEPAVAESDPISPRSPVVTPAPSAVSESIAVPVRGDRFRLPGVALMLSEWWYVRRASRDLLKEFARVRAEEPELRGRSLYARVLVRRSGLDPKEAERVLRRAEQSFTDWESDRTVRFRDVVVCFVFEQFSQRYHNRAGAQTRMGRIVARVIPAEL